MPLYRYQALDQQGKTVRGIQDADSPRALRALLRERGCLPLKIGVERVSAPRGGRLSRMALVLLTQQLATLLNAGLPLERALLAVMEQSEQAAVRRVLEAAHSAILQGSRFSCALGLQPGVFPPLYLALVAAGEQSGHLGAVMLRLADYLQRRAAFRQKLLQALAYPLAVLLVALLVVAGLMTYVVPQVVGVFVQSRQTLPWLTRALLRCSHWLQGWGGSGLLAALLSPLLLARLWRKPTIRRWAERILLRLPVIGRLLIALNTARLASTLAILVASGVPLLSSLATVRSLLALQILQDAVQASAERVREGQTLSVALGQTGLFPPVLVYLIGSGEASGTLALMLERAAEQQEQEVERRLATFSALLEPLLILFMGLVVMVIVLAIMLPIIEMNQMVH